MKQGSLEQTFIHLSRRLIELEFKDRTAFEDTFLIWADYLIRPELVSFQMLDLANKVFESSSDMSDKVVFSLSERFTVSYIEALSGFVKAIQYHYSNRFWKGSDELKIYFDENQKEQLLQTYEQTILVVNEYLRKISYKIDKGNPVLRLENDIAVFMIQYIGSGRMKDGDSSLDIGKYFSVIIDERSLEKSDACENLEEVKMLSIVWKVFPLKRTLSDEPDMFQKMIPISFINMDLTPVQNMCNAYKIAYYSNPKPTNPSFLNCTESFSSSFSTNKIIQKCNIIQPPTLSIDSNPLQTPPKSKPTPSQSTPSTILMITIKIPTQAPFKLTGLGPLPPYTFYLSSLLNPIFFLTTLLILTYLLGLRSISKSPNSPNNPPVSETSLSESQNPAQ